jgi:hypothetical protein
MRIQTRYFTMFLFVFLFIGIFGFVGFMQAAGTNETIQEGQKAMMEGAKKIVDANKAIMDIMTQKGAKDEEFIGVQKMMNDGYNMMNKGNAKMAIDLAEGQELMKHGVKLIMDAQKKTDAAVEKKGLTQICASDLHECRLGEQDISRGALAWIVGSPYAAN